MTDEPAPLAPQFSDGPAARIEIPDLRTGPGPDLNSKLSIGDVMMLAADAGRAFPIFYFPGQDSAPVRYVAVDGDRHFDAVPCTCGSVPRIIYSTDRNGGMLEDNHSWLSLSCDDEECRKDTGIITVFTHNEMFSKARGAMGSMVRSWWNAMRDQAGHPDDHGAHGGMLVTWDSFQKYITGPQGPQQEEEN